MHNHHHEHSCGCQHHHEHSCDCEHNHHEHSCGCQHNHEHHHECECGHHHHDHDGCEHCAGKLQGGDVEKSLIWRLILTAVGFAASLLLPLPGIVRLGLCLGIYLLIGWDVLLGAAKNICRGKVFDEQFLMSIATVGAFAIGEYPEGVAVMLFYQLGEMLQTLAVGKSRNAIEALLALRPDRAVVLRNGKEVTVEPREVAVGELLVIKAGQQIPLDGKVVKGAASLDTAALTGESLPCQVAEGDPVLSGSVNLDGVLYVEVTKEYHHSTVAKILELVEHATEKKAKVENFITRFARYYTPCVVLGAAALAVIPPLVLGGSWGEWIRRSLVFLVVSCPCALVISVPMSFFGGLGGASRKGILIKGAGYLEQLARVDTVLLDKTGTLTEGAFAVSKIVPQGISEEELLEIAARAESQSKHPIAQSIVAVWGKEIPAPDQIRELAGKGLQAVMDGKTYYLGNAALMEQLSVVLPKLTEVGTVIHISRENQYLGYLVIRDRVKENAAEAVKKLKTRGISQVVMLTGDNETAARAVASETGVDACHWELLPQDKVAILEEYLQKGCRVAFAGDGINDAPVLARADVGIAMGGVGSDAAIASADVVLMEDDLLKLSTAVGIARKTGRIVRQNILFALSAKGIILVLGALGIANMWIAVFGDVGVMVLALLNALRAMWLKND